MFLMDSTCVPSIKNIIITGILSNADIINMFITKRKIVLSIIINHY